MTANPDPLNIVLHRDFFAGVTPTVERRVARCQTCGRPTTVEHDCPGHLPTTTLAAVVLAWSLTEGAER